MTSFGTACLSRPRKTTILMPKLGRRITTKPKKLRIPCIMAAINIVVGLFHILCTDL